MRLGEILIQAGAIDTKQLEDALLEQSSKTPRRKLGELLCDAQKITEQQLIQALGQQFEIPVISILSDDMLDSSLVSNLPVDWARTHGVLPIRQNGHVCAVTANPSSIQAMDDLSLLLGCEIAPKLATRTEIQKAIEKCYFHQKDSSQDFITNLGSKPAEALPRESAPSEDLLRVADQAPAIQLINLLLLEAVKQGASDVHVEPFRDKIRVRYRVDGFLYERMSPPKHMESALISRLKVMAKLDIAEKRLPQDGMASVRVGEREIDIRVSTVPVAEGERVVLRLLNRSATLLPLTSLGMPEAALKRFQHLVTEPYGIILVTGPTGSGKTTTLYAAIQQLDTEHINVITIEDPIEYQLPNIGQIQVKPKIGLTFAQGLRHVLRQDPDVILVGEIRDLETAEIAVRSALTGHLVFSTLHTNDAATAMTRMIDMGIEPYLLSSAIKGSLAQRLVRKLCPHCKQPSHNTEGLDALKGKTIWEPKGCDQCVNGYKGRTGIYELIVIDAELQDAVRKQMPSPELVELARKKGMRTLFEEGLARVIDGTTSLSEIRRVVGHG